MKKILILLIVFCVKSVFSQPFQIKGYVKDGASGDLLPGAHILVQSEGNGVVANAYGYFSFSVSTNVVRLVVSFTGYEHLNQQFVVHRDTVITCNLITSNQIGEVEVKGNRSRQIINEEIGVLRLTGLEIEKIPTLFGEKDIIKALQLMPGMKMGKEGSSGLYVRGGTPGQNLMLLDGIPVYNVNHLFGFFSVFTPEAVKSVDVYKGAFPARYGGRISSVIDVKMREGNLYQTKTDITVGNLSSKIIFETPMKKGSSSLLIAARRTYADLLLAPFLSYTSYDGKSKVRNGYYFYDLNVKLFWDLHAWGKLYFSNYMGRDNFHATEKYKSIENFIGKGNVGLIEESKYTYNWGNITSSLRWNKAIGNKLFLNATLLFSDYSFQNKMQDNTTEFKPDTISTAFSYINKSGVSDYGCFADFDYYLSASHRIAFGTRLTSHHFQQRNMDYEYKNADGDIFKINEISDTIAVEINSYFEDNVTLFERWKINAGLHHSYFTIGDKVYSTFQPRVSSSLQFKHWAFKNSIGFMVQPIHNLVNNSNILKVDIWVPSEATVKPSSSLQFDLGASWLFNDSYSLNVEGYWRKMENIITYKSGESFLSLNGHWYDKVISGQGESYGVELMARKNEGKTTGWIAYTWSVCNQQFDKLNNGNPFPFAYDRRHYFTVSLNHQFSKRVQLSANWIFATGEPITLSTTAYNGDSYNGYGPWSYDYLGIITKKIYSPSQLVYLSSINNYRLPNYHRMDVGVDFKKEKQRGTRTWSFSVYNAYGRNNPFMVSVEENREGKLTLKNATLFKFLPSVSYRFVFK